MTPTPADRTRLLGITMLALTFLAGAVAGVTVDRIFVTDSAEAAALASPATTTADQDRERHDDRGHDQDDDPFDHLDLTPEQRTRIDEILKHRRAQLDAFWAEAKPRVHALVESTRADLRAVLTPEQYEEYRRLRKEAKNRHGGRDHRHDDPATREQAER